MKMMVIGSEVATQSDTRPSWLQRWALGEMTFLTKGHVTPEELQRRVIGLLNRMIRTKGAGGHGEA